MPSLQRFAAFGRAAGNAVPPVPPVEEGGWNSAAQPKRTLYQRLTAAVPPVPPVPLEDETDPADFPVTRSVVSSRENAQSKNPHTNLYVLSGTGGTGGTCRVSNSNISPFSGDVPFHLEGPAGGTGGTPATALRISRPALLARFEERAAILEFDAGLTRADAETAATREILDAIAAGDASLLAPAVPTIAKKTVESWRAGVVTLSPDVPPCPGVRKWPLAYAGIRAFLDHQHADQAAELGWTTLELFGCHPRVGTIRPDYCGALIIFGGKHVIAVEADLIRYANGLAYRRAPMPAGLSVPVWEFGR